ncbi:MAG: hypothetical protein ACXWYP_09030 [Pseudonocardia sp.]
MTAHAAAPRIDATSVALVTLGCARNDVDSEELAGRLAAGGFRLVADAAEAQPADREALAALNIEVTAYATTIAQARDNNRQGFPVGAEYLRGAGSGLRADALPIVAALVAANSERAEDEMSGQHTLLLLLTGALTLVVLWWLNRELARRFRRRVNVGLAGAAVAVALVTLVAVVFSGYRSGVNDDLRAGSYQRAVDEASARTAANDAKANESLRLIARGSGQVYEDAWAASAATVDDHAVGATLGLWRAYVATHEQIVALDEDGAWDQAVVLATTRGDDGSTASLNAFDAAAQAAVTEAGEDTASDLRSGGPLALVLAILTLLAGVGAAGVATWGVNQRRREFA